MLAPLVTSPSAPPVEGEHKHTVEKATNSAVLSPSGGTP